jgi:hypothetical protein
MAILRTLFYQDGWLKDHFECPESEDRARCGPGIRDQYRVPKRRLCACVKVIDVLIGDLRNIARRRTSRFT